MGGSHTPRPRTGPTRRGVLGALAAAPAAIWLTGCGSDSTSGGGRTVLRYNYWGSSDRAVLIQKCVKLFEQENPGVTVKTSFADFGSYWQKMTTAAAGGNPPDVIEMDYAYIHAMGDHGVLADLSPYCGPGKPIDITTIRPQLRTSGLVGTKRLAIPCALNSLAVMYDAKVYKDAGAKPPSLQMTWDEYLHEAAKVTRHTKGAQFGMTDPAINYQGLEVWLQQNRKALFTSGGQLAFEPADLRRYLRLAQKYREANAVTTPAAINDVKPGVPIGSRRSGAEMTWDNQLAGFIGQRGSNISLALPPTDTGISGIYPKASMLMSAAAASPHLPLAAKFINFMINDLRAGKILNTELGMPPTAARVPLTKGYKGPDAVVRDFETEIAKHQVKTPPPPPQAGAEFNIYYSRVYSKLAYHRIGIDDAVRQIFDQAEVILT